MKGGTSGRDGARGAKARNVGAQPYDSQRTRSYAWRPGLHGHDLLFNFVAIHATMTIATPALCFMLGVPKECQNSEGANRQGVWEVRQRRSTPTEVSLLLVLGTCARSLRSGIAGCSTQTRIGSTAGVRIWNLRMCVAMEGKVEDMWEVVKDIGLWGFSTQVLCCVLHVKSQSKMWC